MELHSNTENIFADVTKQTSEEYPNNNRVSNGDFNTVYFGIYIPPEGPVHEMVGNVFTDKAGALELVKRNKKARFKAFYYYHEALEFSLQGADSVNNAPLLKDDANKKHQEQVSPAVEKFQFRGPKSQDLVKLRKGIETGKLKFVENTVWENPRYLISSGDTPSILQEGFRYNALHVAAKAKSHEMCELILNTISNLDFIELLYGDDHRNSEGRAKMLLDLYLNTPDKGLNETPLHFAVKYGAIKVVEILVSFPQCDKMIKNKYGKLPNQIICDRCDGYSSEKLKSDISMLLEDNYYVPVLRSEDNCSPPLVGEPFSPTSPPRFSANPMHSRVEIHAYAGPMNKKGAETFRKIWKTPPRLLNLESPIKSASSPTRNGNDNIATLKLKDHEKGLETFGRELAAKYEVDWKEYWPFLGSFIDLCSTEGLQQLEAYLKSRSISDFYGSFPFEDRSSFSPKSTLKKGDQNFTDVIENTLCKALQSLHLSNNGVAKSKLTLDYLKDEDQVTLTQADLCPFFCVEKACQVFAHRIAIDVLHFRRTDNCAVKALEMQMKFLEQLMLSYLDDCRFKDVNLHLVHARLGSLILNKLLENCNDIHSVKVLVEEIRDCCARNDNQTFIFPKYTNSVYTKLLCVLGFVLKALTNETVDKENYNCDENFKEVWKRCAECLCNWQIKSKRRCTVKRNNKKLKATDLDPNVSRRLFFEKEDSDVEKNISNQNISDGTNSLSQNTTDDSSSSDDEFYTPSSSMSTSLCCSDEEQFCETVQPEHDIFIEGNVPTKTDHDIYIALRYAKNKLNPKDFPYVYKWHHTVSIFSEEERKSWPVPKLHKSVSCSSKTASTPLRNVNYADDDHQNVGAHASPKSWFRITGANSPRASLSTYRNNISYNL